MLIQGATARIHFDLSSKTGPIDLTDAQLCFIYKHGMYGASAELDCTVTDPANGLAEIILTPSVTSDEGNMYYALRIEFADGTVLKSESCTLYIEPSL
jgi:hypothetical protein